MKIKKNERKYIYPLILFIPCVFTFVFIKDNSPDQNEWLKWTILAISWFIAILLIIWGEIEIKKSRKRR